VTADLILRNAGDFEVLLGLGVRRITLDVMKMRSLAAARVVFAIAAVLALPAVSFAQVTVIISGGFSTAYREVLPEFERTTGIAVTTASGASQGNGPDTIGAMLRRGEPADVVIMNRPGLAELIAQGRIVAGTDLDLAQALMGVAVRAGRPKPDISTVDAFRQTLLRAKTIATGGSNTSVITEILPRLGISNEIEVKIPSRGTESSPWSPEATRSLRSNPLASFCTCLASSLSARSRRSSSTLLCMPLPSSRDRKNLKPPDG
jgi:hypothetical protein